MLQPARSRAQSTKARATWLDGETAIRHIDVKRRVGGLAVRRAALGRVDLIVQDNGLCGAAFDVVADQLATEHAALHRLSWLFAEAGRRRLSPFADPGSAVRNTRPDRLNLDEREEACG